MRTVITLALVLFAAQASKLCLQVPCIPQAIDADFTFLVDVSNVVSANDFVKIKNWLLDFTSQLTLSKYDSQVTIYTYATSAKSYGSLSSSVNRTNLVNSINAIAHDNTSDRNLYQALVKEESEVEASSGFRYGYKHIMVVVSADAWTGTTVLGSSILAQITRKYDMVSQIFNTTNEKTENTTFSCLPSDLVVNPSKIKQQHCRSSPDNLGMTNR
ncbi:von Willebrand factor type A domain protein [Necator americanus]|uniref:von Willebrand factor type A domain protein n=1 Tax=Necator americanus TaxID=51031 RepID=W2T6N7_NECAM|nr:von Willebrand factor type A domain protein [Necator americanus]ETN76806.1 von Willebrand factor type A domain protein [Necator americanus]